MVDGNVLSIPCPDATSGAGSAGLCLDIEIVCFDSGPSPLALHTLWDCDSTSATVGQLVSSDYRDPNNPGAIVVPTGVVAACASGLIVQAEVLCDDNGGFNRVFVLSSAGIVGVPLDFDLSGAPYNAVGLVRQCSADAVTEEVLCDVDQITGIKLSEFIRRWVLNPSTGGVVSGPNDYALDGVTPYAVVGVAADCGSCDCHTLNAHALQGIGPAVLNPVSAGFVKSFTVSVDNGEISITLASGDILTLRARSSRTWDAQSLPASIVGLSGISRFDIIWEEV